MNKKFEYKTLNISNYGIILEKEFNKLGDSGWELIAIQNNLYIFKREVNEMIIKG